MAEISVDKDCIIDVLVVIEEIDKDLYNVGKSTIMSFGLIFYQSLPLTIDITKLMCF